MVPCTPAGRRRIPRLSVITASLLALVCACTAPPASPPGPVTLTVGMPESGGAVADRLRGLLAGFEFERLTSYGPTGRPTPRLVERWSTSSDGLTWRLTIRAGVVFRDGTPLTNAEVVASVEAATADPGLAAYGICAPDIVSVTADGERDVVVRLSRRCHYLLDEMVDIPIRKAVADQPAIGTGPFVLVSRTPDAYTLEANPRYHMGRPRIDRIVTKPYDTLRTAWAEMLRGQLDFVSDVGPGAAEFLRTQSGVQMRTYRGFFCPSIVFNHRRKTALTADVRRALNIAIDRRELVRHALGGEGVPADGPVWPYYWALGDTPATVPFDPDGARAALEGRRGGRVTFTCLVPEGFAFFERLSLLTQRQLRDVGVDMKLESAPISLVFERVGRGDFDAVLVNPIGGPYATVFHRMWHSPDPSPRWNTWGYVDAAVDAALEAMRDAGDETAFRAAVARFVGAIQDDPPALFLVWPNVLQAVSRRFELPEGADGRDAMSTIASWNVRGEERR